MTDTDTDTTENPYAPPEGKPASDAHKLTRRGWTLIVSAVLVVVFLAIGLFVPVPYVAIGPGPTYDTLGKDHGQAVVTASNLPKGDKPGRSKGQLRMTTVSVVPDVTLLGAMAMWVSGRYALAPRELYFPPGQSDADVRKENTAEFQDSQRNAKVAALRFLHDHDPTWRKRVTETAVVNEVTKGGPSDAALDSGDKLIKVNGKPVSSAEQVRAALKGTHPNSKIKVLLQRGKAKPTRAVITLGKAPDQRKVGFMGIEPADGADSKTHIDIKLGDVGGPSAGLMFTLASIDRLSPGDLTGGRHIAGTGEIDADGTVKQIGGIGFKLVGAKEAGAQLFLVPKDNCGEAKSQAPEGMQLIKVSTVDDAVKALRDPKSAPGC